jgi:hypothetical protein
MSKIAGLLSSLAVSRARMQRGISTARACGDFSYVFETGKALEVCDKRIESLKRVVRPEILEDARDRTNASI